MKIIHVVSTFPPRIGGMGQVCFEECKRLAKQGIEVEALTPKFPDAASNDYGHLKVIFIRPIFQSPNGGLIPAVYKKIQDAQLVHLHYPFYGGAEFVWLASKLKNKKYIITYHMDARANGIFGIIQKIYDFILAKKILTGAAKVITVDSDHFNNSKFGQFIVKNKVVEIFNGVDIDIFRPLSEIKKTKIILFVGNLLSFKRFDLLLKAIAGLKESGVSVKLKVIGGGFEENNLKKLSTEFDIDDQVEFVGQITDRRKLAQEYNSARCIVVSSDRGESFSLTAIESLACGTPVITSDIPGVRGRVMDSQTGYLFKSGSADDLKNKLEKMLNLSENEYQNMSRHCRQEAEKKYGWDAHVEKLAEVYKKQCNCSE